MPGTISQYQVVIAGQLITAALWNGMENNIINNGLIWSGIDDYSANDSEMQVQTDPYPASATSRPTSAQGELERIRYQIAQITGETYWYIDPDVSIASMKTNFDAHTHDGTTNNGPQINTGGIADGAISTAKLGSLSITNSQINDVAASKITGQIVTAQITDSNITTAKIANANVTAAKLETNIDLPGSVRASGTPCFSAVLSTNQPNETGDGTLVNVPFDTEIIDQAGNYNNSTSTFTAPVTGQYLFSVHVGINGAASGNKVELFLVTTGRTYCSEAWPASNISQTLTIIAPMTSGDTALVRLKGSGGSKVMGLLATPTVTGSGNLTFFSGQLIA